MLLLIILIIYDILDFTVKVGSDFIEVFFRGED